MAFNAPLFIFLFLPFSLLIFIFLKNKAVPAYLVAVSLFFYFWGEGAYLLLPLLSIGVNHLLGIWIGKRARQQRGRRALLAGLILNLLPLSIFKYGRFLIANINIPLHWAGLSEIPQVSLHLPLGISFYTFLAISYLVDTYRQPESIRPNPIETGFYISFFPAILAGPLNRCRPILDQLRRTEWDIASLGEGIRRFIIGLGKKVLIANTMATTVNPIFATPAGSLTAGLAWVGIAAFALQIYFDFSGYSDMAIGLGRMFGFRFVENFNYPYAVRTIGEFWTRWHISLSSWLRDYVFLPVAYAVSRRIRKEKLWRLKAEAWSYGVGILVTMFLCGLWHGPSWSFIVWGLWQGGLMLLERFRLRRWLKKQWVPLQHLYALLAIGIGWVFFRSPTLGYALKFLKAMAGFGKGAATGYGLSFYATGELIFLAAVGVLGSLPFWPRLQSGLGRIVQSLNPQASSILRRGSIWLGHAYLGLVLLASVMAIAGGTHTPFIYFRF